MLGGKSEGFGIAFCDVNSEEETDWTATSIGRIVDSTKGDNEDNEWNLSIINSTLSVYGVFHLDSGAQIVGGNGTHDYPYVLANANGDTLANDASYLRSWVDNRESEDDSNPISSNN